MKHFYEHQDDSMRSKLTEHEFEMPQGAWENMAERLDALNQPSEVETASWSAWFIIGAMLIATTVGLVVYQWQMPFGKNQAIAEESTLEKEASFDKAEEKLQKNNAILEQKATIPAAKQEVETKADAGDDQLPPVPATPMEEAPEENAGQAMAIAENPQEQEIEDAPEEQKPEVAPNPDFQPDGQRPENFNTNKPVYTRKTIVTHAFSESTLKWRNNQLPTLSAQPAIQKAQARLLRDTPIIVLENPYIINNNKDWEYGLSAGLNTKVYGANGEFSVSPVLGAFIRKKLDAQFSIQADLQYKNLRKQSLQNPLGQNKEPDYVFLNVITEPNSGTTPATYEERMAEVYEMKQMHMIELPLSFLYQIHPKHQVGMGVKAAYLFGFQSGNATIDAMDQKDLGYNSLDLGALASYEYQINDHFALGVIYNVGFLNLVKQSSEMEATHTATWGANYDFSASQQTALESSMGNEETMMPIRVTEDEQIFLQTPRSMYNTDLRILLRYFF
jgi:hypothetical protein